MRARGEAPVGLTADPHWLGTVQRVVNLSSAPPLVLTEGHS